MWPDDVVGTFNQQLSQVPITCFGDAKLRVAVAGLTAPRPQAEITADIPTSLEVDISELPIGAQLRISDLTMPAGVTTEIDPETAIAIGQPPRVVTLEAEGEEVEEGAGSPAGTAADASADEG